MRSSTYNGKSWDLKTLGPTNHLYSATYICRTQSIAVGEDGLILIHKYIGNLYLFNFNNE